MLDALEQVFARTSTFSKLSHWRKLVNLKCDKNSSLEDHFLIFDTLVRDLETLGSKLDDSDKICHLLLTLPSEYDTVITAIETIENVKMEFVKSRLLDEEMKIHGKLKCEKDDVSFGAGTKPISSSGCYECGNKYHLRYNCPKLSKNRGRGGNNFRRPLRGNRNFYRGQGRGDQTNNYANEAEVNFIACLSLQNDNDNLFVVDSGCSRNMIKGELEDQIHNVELLNAGIKVRMANGTELLANKKGNLKITVQGIVANIEALVVPGLKQNLLSVSQITSKNSNKIIFENKKNDNTNVKRKYCV